MNMPEHDVTQELPLGLGMALAQNTKALEYFSALSPQERQKFIAATHDTHSPGEMRRLVEGLVEHGTPISGHSYEGGGTFGNGYTS